MVPDELISRANTITTVPAWQIGAPKHGQTVQAFAWTVRPLHGPSGFPCRAGPPRGAPIVANTTGQSGYAYAEPIVLLYSRFKRIRRRS
jgi:hypothetical protein